MEHKTDQQKGTNNMRKLYVVEHNNGIEGSKGFSDYVTDEMIDAMIAAGVEIYSIYEMSDDEQ